MSKFAFSDPTDSMTGTDYRANKKSKAPSGIVLHFRHVPTNNTAEFKAFLTEFDDDFKSEWTAQEVWGRMDKIKTFKNTERSISISWTVPAHSEEEAISNFQEIGKMNTFLYPVYEDLQSSANTKGFTGASDAALDIDQIRQALQAINNEQTNDQTIDQSRFTNANVISGHLANLEQLILGSATDLGNQPVVAQQVSLLSSPPIIQMKFMNWVGNSGDEEGLYGTLDNFKFKPDLESGVFISNGNLIPMICVCSVNFTVIHTEPLGWNNKRNLRTDTFPYKMNK